MNEIKLKLFNICRQYVQERIENAESAIIAARESSNDDTKSSAGDKYETTREMMQQEIDRNRKQLDESRKLQLFLEQIDLQKQTDKVGGGSLVYTNLGIFFISISRGQICVDGDNYFAVSALSPIGQILMKKPVGSELTFNGKPLIIEAIE